MYYLRKITRGKWPKEESIAQATLKDVQADTIFAELTTDQNKLSVWEVETEEDIIDAFIALGSNCSYFGAIEAVKINGDILKGIDFDNEAGDTPAIEINEKHRNIINLNYVSLGEVVSSILYGLRNDGYVRKNRRQMRDILVEAYNSSKLDTTRIEPTLLNEIQTEIEKHK